MDWGKIKAIFILTFLFLNIFLGYQLYIKGIESQLKTKTEKTIEEKLKEAKYKVKIPTVNAKQTLISGQSYNFTKADFSKLNEKGMDYSILGDTLIVGTLPAPLSLSGGADHMQALTSFMKEYVLFGENYRYWKTEAVEESKSIFLHQTFQEKPIFFEGSPVQNMPSGIVEIQLNENGQIEKYIQTYLTISEQENKQVIITAQEALSNLYQKGYLKPGSTVQEILFGYYSLLPKEIMLENTIQVFSPTWFINIDNKPYLVNSIDGTITELKQ